MTPSYVFLLMFYFKLENLIMARLKYKELRINILAFQRLKRIKTIQPDFHLVEFEVLWLYLQAVQSMSQWTANK